MSLGVLDFFAYIGKLDEIKAFKCWKVIFNDLLSGWATDLKEVSQETIDKRALRTGDGSRKISTQIVASELELEDSNDEVSNSLWGWNDSDITNNIKNCVDISYKKFDWLFKNSVAFKKCSLKRSNIIILTSLVPNILFYFIV